MEHLECAGRHHVLKLHGRTRQAKPGPPETPVGGCLTAGGAHQCRSVQIPKASPLPKFQSFSNTVCCPASPVSVTLIFLPALVLCVTGCCTALPMESRDTLHKYQCPHLVSLLTQLPPILMASPVVSEQPRSPSFLSLPSHRALGISQVSGNVPEKRASAKNVEDRSTGMRTGPIFLAKALSQKPRSDHGPPLLTCLHRSHESREFQCPQELVLWAQPSPPFPTDSIRCLLNAGN